jgi:hypothetical protein
LGFFVQISCKLEKNYGSKKAQNPPKKLVV